MPITALKLSLDRQYYVRVDPAYSKIRVFLTPTAGSTSDVEVTLKHVRAYGCGGSSGGEILETVIVPVGTAMVEVVFDLAAMISPEGFPMATRSKELGDYTVTGSVVEPAPPVTASQTCSVLLISPEQVRSRWLLGLSLTMSEIKMVRVQPALITGVRVVDVGRASTLGAGVLAYVMTGQTLAWRGGTPMAVPGGVSRNSSWSPPATRTTSLWSRPTRRSSRRWTPRRRSSSTRPSMTNEDIARAVIDTIDEVERRLYVPLEPKRVVSRMLVKYGLVTGCYDKVVDGHSWYAAEPVHWINIALPFLSLLKLAHLSGWVNDQKSLQVDPSWMQVSEKLGHVNLIPGHLDRAPVARGVAALADLVVHDAAPPGLVAV